MKILPKRIKKQKSINSTEETSPIVVAAEDGLPLLTFPPQVVETLRRTISRLIVKKAFPAQLSMVATLRQEGVTYLSRAFAAILANDFSTSVCAVELNWWCPDATLNLPTTNNGLAGVLAGEITLENAILHSGNPNFSIIPAGRMALADRPVLARSALLKDTLKKLSKQYKHLILDIPAISTTNDAIPLASLGEACCLVINYGVTSVDKVRLALDDIDHLKMLGVVLNKVRISTPPRLLQIIPQDSVTLTGNPTG